MTETNIQCQCGLCCGTLDDFHNHRQATGHEQFREISVEHLTKQALHAIEGLKTFKKGLQNKDSGMLK